MKTITMALFVTVFVSCGPDHPAPCHSCELDDIAIESIDGGELIPVRVVPPSILPLAPPVEAEQKALPNNRPSINDGPIKACILTCVEVVHTVICVDADTDKPHTAKHGKKPKKNHKPVEKDCSIVDKCTKEKFICQ